MSAASGSKRSAPSNQCEGETFSLLQAYWQIQNGTAATRSHRNSNVSKILPVTTLRTIDLAGKKISDPLFSRF